MHGILLSSTASPIYSVWPLSEYCLPLQLRGTGSHGIMMKGCTNTTVDGITMHNVGMFFLIDWTGNGNTVSFLPYTSTDVQKSFIPQTSGGSSRAAFSSPHAHA